MDTGKKARVSLLCQDAELKILTPLRTHGWKANIEQEGVVGESLIVTAERGGHRHRIALLYSCASANSEYKSLATQVEHIFYNGEPYHQDSYAHGVDKPVGPVSGFFSLLLEWNKGSSDGVFAARDDDVRESDSGPSHRLLLSETPIEAIWLRLRQFQSVSLAEKLIRDRANRDAAGLGEDVRTKADGVAYALRNASDYYKSDSAQNVSQRILNLYYGTMAFAIAEMLSSPHGPATLAEIESSTKLGHGLYTLDGREDGLKDLVVGVLPSGFFASWLRFLKVDTSGYPQKKPKSFGDLAKLPPESWLTVEQLFARVPEIADLYNDIFDTPGLWLLPAFDQEANQTFQLPRAATKATRTYATLTDGSGRLTKEDIARFPGPISEIQALPSQNGARRFRAAVDHAGMAVWWDALPLYRSPLGRTALILPIFSGVGDFRHICMVTLYALSIIVRYRPSLWRRVQEGDLDNMRVLIEAFLAVVERVLPEQFLAKISGQKVFAKQPGSFF